MVLVMVIMGCKEKKEIERKNREKAKLFTLLLTRRNPQTITKGGFRCFSSV